VRIPLTVSLRFPPEGHSAEGEAVPKSRPIGVDDGQQVNIPALLTRCPRGTHETTAVELEAGPRWYPVCPLERVDARLVLAKALEAYRRRMSWCREKPVGR
jgi:hypothetical protein